MASPGKRRTGVLPHPKDDVFDDSNVSHDPNVPEAGKRGQSPTSEILDSYPDEETFVDERTHAQSGASIYRQDMRNDDDLRYNYERLRQAFLELVDEVDAKDRLDIRKEKEIDDLYVLNGNLRTAAEKAEANSLPAIKAQLSTLASKEEVSQLTEKVESLILKIDNMADAVSWLGDMVGALHARDHGPEDVKGKGPASMSLRKMASTATLPTASWAAKTKGTVKHISSGSPYLLPGAASKSMGILASPGMSTLSLHQQATRTNSPVRARSPDKGLGQHGTSPGKPSPTSQGSPATPSTQRTRLNRKTFGVRMPSWGKRNK